LKILNVNHLLDPYSGGGTAERTFQLSRFLSKAGASCKIATLDIGIEKNRFSGLENLSVVAFPCLNRRYFVPRVSFSAMDRLVADADIVHLSGHWTLLNALAYISCRKYRKPFVFCPAGALKPFGRSILLKRLYDFLLGKKIAMNASACVAITEEEGSDFSKYGVPSDRVVVIPNGICPEDYELKASHAAVLLQEEQESYAGSPYILFLGRLSEIKGPDLLLDAFARVADRFPAMHLVFAGPDDGMLQSLTEKVTKLSLTGRVHFKGYIGGEAKLRLLRKASLLAIPSRREAMSIVILEAGICRTPVLFTDTCGLESFAKDGAGTMVNASVDALAQGLAEILTNDEAVSIKVEKLESIVRQHYLWSMQAERYLALYARILEKVTE